MKTTKKIEVSDAFVNLIFLEVVFYIKDIAEYLQKSFNGQPDVPMSDVWALLDNHPIFPSDGFRPQIKNELKRNHGASVSRSTISFVDRS